jgi:S-disulfanyl-L-cysteine oxidoreductase SoxD
MKTACMRVMVFAGAMAMAATLGWLPVHAQDGQKTTWDGVYTADQAKKGEALYNAQCAKCHGDSAMGGDAPSLADSGFAGAWDTLDLSQLSDRIRVSMPLDAPGTLTRAESADIVAYLLRQNRFPDGQTALPDSAAGLSMVKYVATKPEGK